MTLKPMPEVFSLKCLSLVSNQIVDLEECLQECIYKTHRLEHLTLIQNPCCPFLQPDSTPEEFDQYRKKVITSLKSLQSLDGSNITREERVQAVSSSIHEIEPYDRKKSVFKKGEKKQKNKKGHPAPKP